MVALVREKLARSTEPLRVYWHEVTAGSRTEFARRVVEVRGNVPIVPIVLRGDLFNNANALLSDLHVLMERNKGEFDTVTQETHNGICIVLLTRSRLRFPQVSSPVVLPGWFPVRAGREVHVRLVVLVDAIEVTLLNADEARVERMAELLYELERVLVERLEDVSRRQAAVGGRLFRRFDLLLGGAPKGREDYFREWQEHLAATRNPRAYRPSVRSAKSVASLIIRMVVKSSPDEIGKVGRELGEAVGVGAIGALRPPLLSVLLRPSGQQTQGGRVGHAILLTVYGAYQFITGAAHAGEYPAFSVNLIHSTSRDLCRALQDSSEFIRSLAVGD